MNILKLEASNILRLSAVTITPQGNAIVIGGENAQGKSSVLNSIAMALAGEKFTKPLRDGAQKGKIEIDLGEITVTRTFTHGGGGTLSVKNKEGVAFSSPQTMLDKLIGQISFDPLAFTREKSARQLEILRQLAGVDTSKLDADYKTAFDERTNVNRDLRAQESRLSGITKTDAPAEEVSMVSLSDKLANAQSRNSANASARESVERMASEGRQLSESAKRIKSGAEAMTRQLDELTRRIEEETLLLAKEEKRLSEFRALYESKKKEVSELEDEDTASIRQDMANADQLNRKVRANRQYAEESSKRDTLSKQSRELDTQLEVISADKHKLIRDAKYPLPGLSLSDDGIVFEGIPFSQASAAEQLRVSMAIALAMNPKLRVCLIRDGSLLDKKALAAVAEMAEKSNAQVWIERVGEGEECQVIIEDGHVK